MASKYQIVFSLQVSKIRIVMLLQEERPSACINNFDTVSYPITYTGVINLNIIFY